MKETSHYSRLTINSETFGKNELVKQSEAVLRLSSRPIWEEDVYRFLLEWLNDSPAVTLQTSGSTGKPKKIIAPKRALAASAKMTEEFFDLRKNDSVLLCLPAAFIAGKMMIVRAFVSGLNLILTPPSTNVLLDLREKVKLAPVVPMQLKPVFARGIETNSCLSQVEHLLVGGAGLSSSLENAIVAHEKEYGYSCHLSYGMTETYSHVAMQKISCDSKKTSFSALKNVSFTTDQESRLVIDAPCLGVENLVTNDVVRLLSATEFELLGRADNVINSGGVKIHPEQVERSLEELLPDHRYFIHGLPDPILGEAVALFIENAAIGQGKMNELLQKIKVRLNPFEVPKHIFPVDRFQLTTSGKIQRQETAAKAAGY